MTSKKNEIRAIDDLELKVVSGSGYFVMGLAFGLSKFGYSEPWNQSNSSTS